MRKSVSVAFFSLMSTLLIFGTVIMGGSELVLFSNYFAQERYDVLDEVVNVAQRTASHLVQEAALPEGEELEALNTKLELIGESAEVYLFFTDCDGNVVLASDPDDLAGDVVEASVLEKSAKAKENYHIFGTLDGVLTEKSYISVHEMRSESGECTGYLFLCSSGDRLVEFRKEFFSNFFLSACLMLLVASVLTKVMMHKLTDPIQKVTDAAQRFGGGDLSADSIPSAIALFLLGKGDVKKTLEYCVNFGGDCDTNGAMAGAMVGAGTSYENLSYTFSLNADEGEQYGVGFRQGSDLTAALNEFFAASKADGSMEKTAETYGVQAALIK